MLDVVVLLEVLLELEALPVGAGLLRVMVLTMVDVKDTMDLPAPSETPVGTIVWRETGGDGDGEIVPEAGAEGPEDEGGDGDGEGDGVYAEKERR